MKDLGGKTAVITGAASGIGLALAKRCLAEGMSVVMADVEADTLAAAAAELQEGDGAVSAFTCDTSDSDQVEALRDHALSTFGSVHLLANNAGVASGRTHLRSTPADLRWVVGVNLLGVAYGVCTFGPLMVEQGEGHIVNTASEAGLTATPFLGSYHTTKYGVVGLSEALYLELEGTGVGVSCLCPELVATKIFESTRNAPADTGLARPAHIPVESLEQMLGTVAMDPADVAADVIYAVRANRFWVLTHQATQYRVAKRNADLERGRNPRGIR